MSYSIPGMSFVLAKDPTNLDGERMFRSFHGGPSPDDYIDKYQLKVPYQVRNCTPEIEAAKAIQGFDAYDPVVPRHRMESDSNRPELLEEHDMTAALAMLHARWHSPALEGDERKAVNDPLPALRKALRTGKRTAKFGGRKPKHVHNWDGINAQLERVIDQQMVFDSSRLLAVVVGHSWSIVPLVSLTISADDDTIKRRRDDGKFAVHPFLTSKKLQTAMILTVKFGSPKLETVENWGEINAQLQCVIDQQSVVNAE